MKFSFLPYIGKWMNSIEQQSCILNTQHTQSIITHTVTTNWWIHTVQFFQRFENSISTKIHTPSMCLHTVFTTVQSCIRTKYLMKSYSTWSQAEGLEILGVVTGWNGQWSKLQSSWFCPSDQGQSQSGTKLIPRKKEARIKTTPENHYICQCQYIEYTVMLRHKLTLLRS